MAALSAAASRKIKEIQELSASTLANTAWAFATLGKFNEPLMDAIAEASIRKIREFDAESLSNTAWAFAVFS